MYIVRRLRGTLIVLRHTASPPVSCSAGPPYCHCADFNGAVDESGRLRLFFPDCFFPAAIFLLFRLKRQGFSDCRATLTDGGILLTAAR